MRPSWRSRGGARKAWYRALSGRCFKMRKIGVRSRSSVVMMSV